MNDLNLCQFIGRLGRDPEIRFSGDGKAVANLSIACGSSWKDKTTGEQQKRTEWVRLVAFGKLAEIIGEYLKKGQQVYVAGRIQTRKYQDKDHHDRFVTEVVLSDMQMLGGKRAATSSPAEPAASKPDAKKPADKTQGANGGGDFDDDIPFAGLGREYFA